MTGETSLHLLRRKHRNRRLGLVCYLVERMKVINSGLMIRAWCSVFNLDLFIYLLFYTESQCVVQADLIFVNFLIQYPICVCYRHICVL